MGRPQPSRPDHETFDSVALIKALLPAQAPFSRAIFVAVILLAVAKGLVWSAVLPPWYGPDEASHYAYVQELVEDHWLARGYDPNAGLYYPREITCSESNLGIGVVSGAFHAEPPFGAPGLTCSASSPSDRHAKSPSNAAGYSPVYYAAAVPFYLLAQPQSVETRLAAVRLWSVLLGVIATAFAYLAARWAFPESTSLGAAAAILFTLQPMNAQQTAIVNNDALLIAVAAAFWWRFFRLPRTGPSIRETLVLGALAGLAYLVKPQGIFLAAALPIAYLVTRETRPAGKEVYRVARLAAAAAGPIIAGVALSAFFSVLAGNTSPLPSSAGAHGVQQYITSYTNGHFERAYWLFITSFWGYFGWFQVDLPSLVFVIITLAVAAGVIGSLLLAFRASPTRPFIVASLLAVVVPIALIMLLELYAFRVSGTLVLQGRSFLILLVPLIVVLIRGWQRWLPREASSRLAAAIVMAALLVNLASLAVIVEAFYG